MFRRRLDVSLELLAGRRCKQRSPSPYLRIDVAARQAALLQITLLMVVFPRDKTLRERSEWRLASSNGGPSPSHSFEACASTCCWGVKKIAVRIVEPSSGPCRFNLGGIVFP